MIADTMADLIMLAAQTMPQWSGRVLPFQEYPNGPLCSWARDQGTLIIQCSEHGCGFNVGVLPIGAVR